MVIGAEELGLPLSSGLGDGRVNEHRYRLVHREVQYLNRPHFDTSTITGQQHVIYFKLCSRIANHGLSQYSSNSFQGISIEQFIYGDELQDK
jgi:hypothetical protein